MFKTACIWIAFWYFVPMLFQKRSSYLDILTQNIPESNETHFFNQILYNSTIPHELNISV